MSSLEGIVIITPQLKPEAFVLSCWLNSYEPRGCKANGLDREDQRERAAYYKAHHPEFTRLLRSSTLALAVDEKERDVYYGWALGVPERGVLHYVFVKSAARNHGIGDALVRAAAGESPRVYTFEPGRPNGAPRAALVELAKKRGMKFHPHPIPRNVVHKQREAMNR